MATVKLSGDLQELAAALRAQGGRLRPAMAAGALAVRRSVIDYYRGISKNGFYASQASEEKVQVTALEESHAQVTVDSFELAHKITGGDVYPIPPRRNLAIPLTDEARAAGYPSNKRIPGVFRPGHVKGVPNSGKHVLAVKDGKGFRALWALVEKVTHQPDPKAQIPMGTLDDAASNAMREAIVRAMRR